MLELDSEENLAGGGSLTHFPSESSPEWATPAVGYRLDWPGHSLAYVTDSIAKPDAAYIEQIKGVDLLLHERALPDSSQGCSQKHGHSCTTPVAQLAAAAKVERLVSIRNFVSKSELKKAQAVFPATEEAFDRMEIEF